MGFVQQNNKTTGKNVLLIKEFEYLPITLREKYPNTEFFLVRIFLYKDWMQSKSPYLVRMSRSVT